MSRFTLSLIATALGLAGHGLVHANEWQQIPLNGPTDYELPNGDVRTVDPSCSAGPTIVDGETVAADPQFSFFYQAGDPRRLLIFFDGGGACWDADTCIGTPLLGASTYSQIVDETPESLANVGGIADANNPDNPYAAYTKVFIPYCSADVHWGARDTTYQLPFPPIEWTIRHRGSDNFLATLAWLRENGEGQGLALEGVRRLTVAGASAGAYGTLIAFPYAAELTPNARLSLIADAGVGVLNESFYRLAIYDPDNPEAANWGLRDAIPTFAGVDETLLGAFASAPLGLPPAWFAALAQYRPRARFAVLTSNRDQTQIDFYALMEFLDGRPLNDPSLPLDWYLRMEAITNLTESLPNYRTFIEDGDYHTILGEQSYYQAGQSGVSTRDWNQAMITLGLAGWDNIDVGSPF